MGKVPARSWTHQACSQHLINHFAAVVMALFCRGGHFRIHFKCILTVLSWSFPPRSSAKSHLYFRVKVLRLIEQGTSEMRDLIPWDLADFIKCTDMFLAGFSQVNSCRLHSSRPMKPSGSLDCNELHWAVVQLLPDLSSHRFYRVWAPDREALRYIIRWNLSPFHKPTIYSPRSI